MILRALPLAALAACSGDGKDNATGETGADSLFPTQTADAVATYAAIVRATYSDSLAAAGALDAALEELVASPSQQTLEAARTAWLASREPYLQSEVFRFYDGPIDNPEDGPEGLINAWPLDENYIDYVEGDPTAGAINDLTVTIDASTLEGRNEVGGEKNIATGFHAIEFLLWGQDQSPAGPGARPHTDYVTDGTGTAQNQDRRGQYLTVAGDLLLGHLGQVNDAWAEGAPYRSGFEADPEGSFAKILAGMIILSGFETGGERLQAALDSGDQEDEHSCFSDNTHRDMIQDIQGVRNVWTGSYGAVTGVSVRDVVAEVDADLASALDARIDESLALANALPVPFDSAIAPGSEGRAAVQALVDSLRDQEGLLFQVFEAFGLTVTIPE